MTKYGEYGYEEGYKVPELNTYEVMFANGAVVTLTKEEEGKENIIGLWIWSGRQTAEVFLSFKEATIRASAVISISKVETRKVIPIPDTDDKIEIRRKDGNKTSVDTNTGEITPYLDSIDKELEAEAEAKEIKGDQKNKFFPWGKL